MEAASGGLLECREDARRQPETGDEDVGIGADRDEAGPDEAVRDRLSLEGLTVRRVEGRCDPVRDQEGVLDGQAHAAGAEPADEHVECPAVGFLPGEVGQAVHGARTLAARRERAPRAAAASPRRHRSRR